MAFWHSYSRKQKHDNFQYPGGQTHPSPSDAHELTLGTADARICNEGVIIIVVGVTMVGVTTTTTIATTTTAGAVVYDVILKISNHLSTGLLSHGKNRDLIGNVKSATEEVRKKF